MAVTKPSAYPPLESIQKRYDPDASNNIIYEGWSMPGALTSDAGWAIKKYTYDANNNCTREQWADGNTNMDNVWDNRVGLTYA